MVLTLKIVVTITDQVWGGKHRYMFDLLCELRELGHRVSAVAEAGSMFAAKAGAEFEVNEVSTFDRFPADQAERIGAVLRDADVVIMTGRRDLKIVSGIDAGSIVRIFIRHSGFLLAEDEIQCLERVDLVVATAASQGAAHFANVQPERLDVWLSAVGSEFLTALKDVDRASARRALGAADDDVVLLVSARLSWEKAVRRVVAAVAAVRTESPRLRLVIAGSGEEEAALRAQSETLGLHDSLKFLGHVEEMAPIYFAADVVVLASDVPETGPLSLKEAMLASCATIAPNLGGIPEFVTHGQTGLLFDDDEQLIDAIRTVAASAALRQRLADAGSRHVRAYHLWASRIPAIEGSILATVMRSRNKALIKRHVRAHRIVIRPEEWGGLLFVPSTSQIAEISKDQASALGPLARAGEIDDHDLDDELLDLLTSMGALQFKRGWP